MEVLADQARLSAVALGRLGWHLKYRCRPGNHQLSPLRRCHRQQLVGTKPGADQIGSERSGVSVGPIVIRTVPESDAFEAMLKGHTQERRGSVAEYRMSGHMVVQVGFARREDHSVTGEMLVGLP